jgi:hypothetical protein
MHAFDLLSEIYAPLQFVQFDERPVVRQLYAAVAQQVSSADVQGLVLHCTERRLLSVCPAAHQIYNPDRLVYSSYGSWIREHFEALCIVADYHGVRYADLSPPDCMVRLSISPSMCISV